MRPSGGYQQVTAGGELAIYGHLHLTTEDRYGKFDYKNISGDHLVRTIKQQELGGYLTA